MPVVNVLIYTLVAVLYLGYLACAVPLAAIIACAAYALAMPAAYFAALWRVLVSRPPWLPGPARRPKIPADAEPAVLQYFYGPALADADHAIRVALGSGRDLWRRGAREIRSSFGRDKAIVTAFTAPIGAGGAVGMAAGTAVGTVAAAGCAVVQLAAVGISAAFVRAAGAALRGADSAVLRIKNIRMVCPNPECYERVPYPGYECPARPCTRRHRDIRPGRFGIVRRRCQCGARMKTLLLFGSARMNAFCPRCGNMLEHRPGKVPEIVLPFFGAIGAGKTRLLFSMVAQLLLWSNAAGASGKETSSAERPDRGRVRELRAGPPGKRRPGGKRLTAEFADSATADMLDKLNDAIKWLSPHSATAKTPPELPRAYVIRLTAGHDTALLHMFDAAGEFFSTPGRTQDLRFFSKSRTFILVIDPLSVEAFRNRLTAGRPGSITEVTPAVLAPELAYQQAHQEIEAMGVRLRKARLAVVFSRADLIDAPEGDVAAWATDELGLGNLVRSARLDFAEACFFRTGAVMQDGGMHSSVPVLIRWLLAGHGFNLPGDLL